MMLTKILLPKKFKPPPHPPHPPLTLFQVSSITADLNLDLNLMCKVRCFVSNRSKTIRMQVFFMFIKLRFALWPIKSNWIYDFSFSFGWTGYFLSCPPVFHYCKEKNFFDEILHLHRRASGCPFFLGTEQRRHLETSCTTWFILLISSTPICLTVAGLRSWLFHHWTRPLQPRLWPFQIPCRTGEPLLPFV